MILTVVLLFDMVLIGLESLSGRIMRLEPDVGKRFCMQIACLVARYASLSALLQFCAPGHSFQPPCYSEFILSLPRMD